MSYVRLISSWWYGVLWSEIDDPDTVDRATPQCLNWTHQHARSFRQEKKVTRQILAVCVAIYSLNKQEAFCLWRTCENNFWGNNLFCRWDFFFKITNLLMYFWLCWVFTAVSGPSLVEESGGYSWCTGFSGRGAPALGRTGFSSCSRRASVVVAPRL